MTQKFNNEIVFDPERNMMAYTLRDPVSVGIFPGKETEKKIIDHFGKRRFVQFLGATEKRPRGKANRIEVKSR